MDIFRYSIILICLGCYACATKSEKHFIPDEYPEVHMYLEGVSKEDAVVIIKHFFSKIGYQPGEYYFGTLTKSDKEECRAFYGAEADFCEDDMYVFFEDSSRCAPFYYISNELMGYDFRMESNLTCYDIED